MGKAWLAIMAAALFGTRLQAAPAIWRVATSEHFTIYSRESAPSLKKFAERLELFDAALRHLFPVKTDNGSPPARLTIYSLDGAGAVQRVMGAGSTNVYGVYRPSITGSLALTARENDGEWGLNTQIVLLHEYAHYFMLTNFPAAYPTWLVEGFAEFASTARFETDGGIGIGAPAKHRAYGLFSSEQLSWNAILADELDRLTSEQRESLYARGWLLTHMLFFDRTREGQIDRYVQSIAKGTMPIKAATDAFGDTNQLAKDLDKYLHRRTISYIKIAAAGLAPASVTVHDTDAAESAIIPVRIDSKYGVDRTEALRLVPLARRAAGPFPNEPAAQCMLAEAEDDAGYLTEADAAADRLLATDPKNYCGLLFKGEIAMHRAMLRKAPTADKEWGLARNWFVKANRADVENPLPMFYFYQTYLLAGAKPSTNAIDALLGAAERAPQDENARVLATVELLRLHREKDARAMLGPVANSAHNAAGSFLAAIYRDIGDEPADRLADRLAAGPLVKPVPPAGS